MVRFIARRKLISALCAPLALAGSAFFVLQAQPASAATNQFKGVNWADTRDNYNTGWVIPDGLAASDNYSQVYSIANNTWFCWA